MRARALGRPLPARGAGGAQKRTSPKIVGWNSQNAGKLLAIVRKLWLLCIMARKNGVKRYSRPTIPATCALCSEGSALAWSAGSWDRASRTAPGAAKEMGSSSAPTRPATAMVKALRHTRAVHTHAVKEEAPARASHMWAARVPSAAAR